MRLAALSAGGADEAPAIPPSRVGRHRRSRPWWPFVVPLAVAALLVMLAFPGARHQLDVSLVRQPARYTTLAFVEPTALPTVIVAGKPLAFRFSVGNNEGSTVAYRYFVLATPSKKSSIFTGGSVAVREGRTRSVRVSAVPTCSGSPCRISVLLVNVESIDFNVKVTGVASHEGSRR